MHYGTSEAEARMTAADCGGAELFQANLEDVAEIERLFREVGRRMGRLDGLVNNAARFTKIRPLEITEADWDSVHSVNLKATFFCCQQGAKLMKQTGGGRIVNISSLGGVKAWANHAHYCASKAGVIHLTKALAKAFAPEISVNSVAPGTILEPENGENVEALVSATPAKRRGTVDEVAEAVTYFLRATRFVTGQLLVVDGGLGLR
jgi:3-oxoacyl-[acyl-carrier protein] reductase/pteridine reductase